MVWLTVCVNVLKVSEIIVDQKMNIFLNFKLAYDLCKRSVISKKDRQYDGLFFMNQRDVGVITPAPMRYISKRHM